VTVYSADSALEIEATALAGRTGHDAVMELTGRRHTELPDTRLRAWTGRLVALDAAAVGLASFVAFVSRFGNLSATTGQVVDYRVLVLGSVPVWLAAMAIAGTYDSRFIAAGTEQYRRVVSGAVWVLAAAGFASFALHANLSRAFVLVAIPAAAVFTIAERYAVRRLLHRQFAAGRAAHRVLVIGLPPDVRELVVHMRRAFHAGFGVVAALTPGESSAPALAAGVSWAGADLEGIVQKATDARANTIVVAAPHLLAPGWLRRLSWDLEGTDIELVLAPAITDIAGPRIRTRPVDGLPLLCVEKPQFDGPHRFAKSTVDRALSGAGLVALSPLLLVAALAVRLSGRGPVLYTQTRVGLRGEPFALLKFRTMRVDAEAQQPLLSERNESDGVLFKIRRDPRITAVGAFMRRWSIDELPQLWNVVRGHMSLVGPRPPLPSEVERYGSDVHRRLLVKPGITGLWQVSGRSDLSWDETVRLDLHYVDNWSFGLDLVLLWKTLGSVLRGRGAY
jgi:exopolysaccharide biosynthesis polyprenyl glycosylphosphotransferase